MSEVREALHPYLNKRIRVRGTLSAFRDWIRNYRDVRRACISDPEMDGEVLAHHVWVLEVSHWPTDQVGQQVEFSAVVKSYVDRDGTTNYCLGQADAPEILH